VPSEAPKNEAPPETGSDTRVLGFVVGGAGVVALGVGTVFGLQTLSEKGDASNHCNTSAVCDPTGYQSGQDAHRSATISTVGFGVGLAATAVGVWLVLRSSHAGSSPAAVGVAPGGLVLRGRF
jgi:hypothetical protein